MELGPWFDAGQEESAINGEECAELAAGCDRDRADCSTSISTVTAAVARCVAPAAHDDAPANRALRLDRREAFNFATLDLEAHEAGRESAHSLLTPAGTDGLKASFGGPYRSGRRHP